jgi:hypothetical protein
MKLVFNTQRAITLQCSVEASQICNYLNEYLRSACVEEWFSSDGLVKLNGSPPATFGALFDEMFTKLPAVLERFRVGDLRVEVGWDPGAYNETVAINQH